MERAPIGALSMSACPIHWPGFTPLRWPGFRPPLTLASSDWKGAIANGIHLWSPVWSPRDTAGQSSSTVIRAGALQRTHSPATRFSTRAFTQGSEVSTPGSRKGTRWTPEEIEASRKTHSEGMIVQGVIRFEYDRKRVKAAGVTHYLWRTSKDADVCEACHEREGQTFPYDAELEFRHPGTFECCTGQPCRCYCEPILPEA